MLMFLRGFPTGSNEKGMTLATRWSSLLLTSASAFVLGLALRRASARLRFSLLPWRTAQAGLRDEQDLETRIDTSKTVLLALSKVDSPVFAELAKEFCGTVVIDASKGVTLAGKTVYVCGDLAKADRLGLNAADRVFVIHELAHGCDDGRSTWPVVGLGQVPLLVHGVGIFYRRFFDLDMDCFGRMREEHSFQTLTESTKPGTAHRTGIYLTPVEEHGEQTHFRLLRCSTNFSGPTVDFGEIDRRVVSALNEEASVIFENGAPLNHVLAQIYHNMPATASQKQTKAKIKAHSDKTKDMPGNGLMAFCTFYRDLDRLKPLSSDAWDYGHKGVSGLTKLDFRLKPCVAERPGCTLAPRFSVTLYPNSVFFMPLSTNRLYTHEIRAASLDAHMLPTRLGYVVRCSNAEAVHQDGQTFIRDPSGNFVALEPPTKQGMENLRALYAEENSVDSIIDYSKYGPLLFSMNKGDYMKPCVKTPSTTFRSMQLHSGSNLFDELASSVEFQDVGKGRQGNVLVKPDKMGRVPIVRTTTKYSLPAQSFGSVHTRLAQTIEKIASLPVSLNNALIEKYTNAYTTMGFHSDQALDLEAGTCIAVYSCYRHPELAHPPRKLVIESKEANGGSFEIPLSHDSVVVFSLETNRQYRHKIVLDASAQPPANEWLGVTFRTSKTFVSMLPARFADGTVLHLASEEEKRQFLALRSRENKEKDFEYPFLPYTISASDLLPPCPGDRFGCDA